MLDFVVNREQHNQPKDLKVSAPISAATQKSTQGNASTLLLPPPKILWAWLSYIYRCTGEWLMPPTDTEASIEMGGLSPNFTTSSFAPENASEPSKNSSAVPSETTLPPVAYQLPIPAMLPYAPVATQIPQKQPRDSVAKLEDNFSITTTGFSYVNSVYALEAEKLIVQLSSRPPKPELAFGCKLVLTLIIAWCHFPLFRNPENQRNYWMTLAFDRCTRELKMRANSFKLYLTELQDAGLIETGSISTGIISRDEFEQLRHKCASNCEKNNTYNSFWKPRSIQEKTCIYRLKISEGISPSLPTFDPLSQMEGEGNARLLSLEGHGRTSSVFSQERETLMSSVNKQGKVLKEGFAEVEVLPKYFPAVPCNDLIHDYDDRKKEALEQPKLLSEKITGLTNESDQFAKGTNRSQLEMFVESLNPEQKAKFDFLNNVASFASFRRSGGRTTLDTREVLKFALNPALTLERIKERYNQVSEMWLKGECKKSPLGLLHWSLTKDADPRSNDDQSLLQVALQQAHQRANYQRDVNITNDETSSNGIAAKTSDVAPVVTTESFASPRVSDLKKANHRTRKSIYQRQSPYRSINREGVQRNLSWPDVAQPQNAIQDKEFSTEENWERQAVLQPEACLNADQLWKLVKDDLQDRFRLNQEELKLLDNSRLLLPDNKGEEGKVVIILPSVFEERRLTLTTRNTIRLALRQRFGPFGEIDFQVNN